MNRNNFMERYNLKLTQQQLEAAVSIEKPTLLLAVPGSGKTTALVSRVGYMVHQLGIPAEKILTVTYTEAASRDMKARYEELFGEGSGVKFQTINALCQAVIYRYSRLSGRPPFEVLEKNHEVLREVYLQVQQEFPGDSDIKNVQLLMTYIKNMMLTPEEIAALKKDEYKVKELYETYTRLMRERGLMDFDDQMVYARRILNRYPEILEYYRNRYPYICVDEAQDTSRIQHEIIGLLAARDRRIFMVGDEDQSIYGFRAAYPKALIEFQKVYPEGQVLLLEQNFRSTPQIVQLADAFIGRNRIRHEKHMFTERPGGAPVKCLLLDRKEQYRELVRLARENTPAAAGGQGTTAILYRNNESAIPVIYRFIKEGIPFRSRGMDTAFFSTPAVQFLKDIFRFAYTPSDCEIFMRIYWKLDCFIKKEEAFLAVRLCQEGQAEGPLEALLRMESVAEYNKERIRRLKGSLMSVRNRNAAASVSGFTQLFDFHKDEERYFVLSYLAEPRESSAEFLQKLDDLQQLLEKGSRDPAARIVLSTIHSSKGLEYDRVIIIDAVDGILPSSEGGLSYGPAKSASQADLEEERRLFYVAATRAREELILFSYKDKKCRFFDEFLQRIPPEQGAGAGGGDFAGGGYAAGSRVRHTKFGSGVVKRCDGTSIEIEFRDHGRKKFLLEIAGKFLSEE